MLNIKVIRNIAIALLAAQIIHPGYAVASDYVLPYPSYMPGHKLYKPRQALEKVEELWYFGDMSKVKYHLKLSDKYLVEAQTLFNYNQMLLASVALQTSNEHFVKAVLYERDVVYDRKDNGEQKQMLQKAGVKHMQVLDTLKQMLPKEITWREEKKEPQSIQIDLLLRQSSLIRNYANL